MKLITVELGLTDLGSTNILFLLQPIDFYSPGKTPIFSMHFPRLNQPATTNILIHPTGFSSPYCFECLFSIFTGV